MIGFQYIIMQIKDPQRDSMELKPDNELNASDLLKAPVWEFAFKEMKEQGLNGNLMKPSDQTAPYSPHKARILVRATFQLKDGTIFKGHILPIDLLNPFASRLAPVDLRPVIVTLKGPVEFWYGTTPPSRKRIADNYRLLGKLARDVFPVTVKADVELDHAIGEAPLNGVLYCDQKEIEDFFHIKEKEIKVVR